MIYNLTQLLILGHEIAYIVLFFIKRKKMRALITLKMFFFHE